MNDQEIIEKLQSTIRRVLGREDIVLTRKTKLEDLGVSSFGMVQIVCAIEDEFDIEIPNVVIKSMRGIPAAVRFIKRVLRKKS